MEERKKNITILLKMSELLYDIRNNAYIEGDVMKTDDEHQRHNVFDIAEDGNINRVFRMLSLAFSKCAEACYPYSKTPVGEYTYRDDTLEAPEEFILILNVPESFSQTTADLLAKLLHELMVDYVLADWLSITKPEAQENWLAKAAQAKDEIGNILNNRYGRTWRKMSPW